MWKRTAFCLTEPGPLLELTGMVLLVALTGCGGGPSVPAPAPVSVTVGAAGGTVVGPSGAKVVIPAGALATDTVIGIAQTDVGAPALPSGTTTFGPTFTFTPHGTVFAKPVTMSVPFDPAKVPTGSTPELLKTNAQNAGWDVMPGGTVSGNVLSAQVTGFSSAVAALPPLTRNDPQRFWQFWVYKSDMTSEAPVTKRFDQTGGPVDDLHDYGPQTFTPDQRAIGTVHSSADGRTYSAFAEGPQGSMSIPESQIGNLVELEQAQSFVKNQDDASLKLVITAASVVAANFNPTDIIPFECSKETECKLELRGQIELAVDAYSAVTNIDFHGDNTIGLVSEGFNPTDEHGAPFWTFYATVESGHELWTQDDFNFDIVGEDASFDLKAPITINLDLSKVEKNKEFTVRIRVKVKTFNQIQGESLVVSYFRDPESENGSSMEFTGLTPSNNPLPLPTEPRQAPECTTGTDPAAGTLQFSAPSFDALEIPFTKRPVLVTRVGGSKGEVSARVRSTDGTAQAGVDYSPVETVVFFGDGETAPRSVQVPLILDTIAEPDKTLTLTLSDPRGCAALGTQTTTTLNILDNDRPIPPPADILDPSFGAGGKVTTDEFGGKDTAMALQADGKIVMVGGGFTSYLLARYNAGGTLDTGFGAGGKVTLDISGGNLQQRALGVAVQTDGKIVVVGETLVPGGPAGQFTFGLARFNADGSLDSSFGEGGKVIHSTVVGNARAVALQPDGKLLVAGISPVSGKGSDFGDFLVARYNADGSLDSSFGSGGEVVTDFGGTPNDAHNIVIQPDGHIVVSGSVFNLSSGINHTDIARYNPGGLPDTSFGSGGTLHLSNMQLGDGLALQPDGKLVLVGNVETATLPNTATQFLLMRINADGTTDQAFGSAGLVQTAFSSGGDAARAVGIASDGKILVAGKAKQGNSEFAVARYNPDGSLDARFGSGGKFTIEFGSFGDGAESLAIQPDGKIVLGGFSQGISSIGYALARISP